LQRSISTAHRWSKPDKHGSQWVGIRRRSEGAFHYRQTLALADELGTGPLAARSHLSLCMLDLKIRRGKQARPELPTAIGLYRSMDMRY
jgi:hypothetical protein